MLCNCLSRVLFSVRLRESQDASSPLTCVLRHVNYYGQSTSVPKNHPNLSLTCDTHFEKQISVNMGNLEPADAGKMRVSVLVPTFRRVERLGACLDGLARQTQAAVEVIVVCRGADSASIELVRARAVTLVLVDEPGVIAAMNAGVAAASGEIIALTDDDAVPWADWVQRIERHFGADPKLGCLGGKDWQYKGEPLRLDDGRETRAGEMQWWGRTRGMHHWAAAGPPREVAVVKGVNMAFRAEVLRALGGFDTRLAGTGAQVHWELAACLAAKRAGWKVVFDPSLGVDHFPAERFDEDRRDDFNGLAQRNAVFNETLVMAEHLPPLRRAVFAAWVFAIGTRSGPGVLQLLRLALMRQRDAWPRFVATMRGRLGGLRAGMFGSIDRQSTGAVR